MGESEKYLKDALGIRIPEEYGAFMEKYGNKLAADPLTQKSWISGLGDREFVVGTTQAFRARVPGFSSENMVIGWLGMKTIVMNKVYEEIDNYMMLDTKSGAILAIDSLGVMEVIAGDFDGWVSFELLRAQLKERYQSTLTVVMFDNESKAKQARENLINLQRQGHIDLEDMIVVVKKQDGDVQLRQEHKPARKGGLAGSITGFVVGSLFFSPLIGAVLGAVAGALPASLADMGIDDQFAKNLSQKFKPGCSALFTLVRQADPERIKEAFLGFGGKVLVNSFNKETETRIQAILDATQVEAE
ncbi:MAG: DUF1269 domain-containing protein [Syntrophobacteraceae bacterium]|nr:DUF1269 domain-containing protein [Syntrophobacteraceae bacterium]